MSRIPTLALIAAITTAAFPALANGTLPAPAPVAPTIVTPVSDWSGGYVGGSLGYAMHSAFYCDDGAAFASCSDPDTSLLPNPEPEGGIIGVTAGYDWQNGSIVYGIAGDLMFGDLSDTVGDTAGFGCASGCGLEVTSVAVVRGRVGYDMGNFLPYATAGVAMTQASSFEGGDDGSDGTFTNLVVGLGADYRVSDTITVGMDFLHLLENDDSFYDDTAPCGFCGVTTFSANIVRFNVAYRF